MMVAGYLAWWVLYGVVGWLLLSGAGHVEHFDIDEPGDADDVRRRL